MILEYSEYYVPGPIRKVVFLLHGYGSNKDDLISIAPELSKSLAGTLFISPNACKPMPGSYLFAYQWFELEDRREISMLEGAGEAALILKSFIQYHTERLGLTYGDAALVGFSQGGMLALHAGLRYDLPVRAIISYSGMIISPNTLKDEITNRPEILLVHGKQDQVVPFSMMNIAKKALDDNNVISYSQACEKLAHGIDAKGISMGADFLQRLFM
jgi:phospholipase/carboxylesterase